MKMKMMKIKKKKNYKEKKKNKTQQDKKKKEKNKHPSAVMQRGITHRRGASLRLFDPEACICGGKGLKIARATIGCKYPTFNNELTI